MKYKVEIKSPNKLFLINGREVRSPFITEVDKNTLNIIKSKIRFYGLLKNEYEIIDENEDLQINILKRSPDTKNRNEKIVKKTNINKINLVNNLEIKNNSEPEKPTEQNINKIEEDILDNPNIKLKEISLNLFSKSILSKIANDEF